MTAAKQVFDTAELLEIIICQCEPHQVQEPKLVSRSWRDSIASSRAIRRSLVLSTEWWVDVDGHDDDRPIWLPATTCTYSAADRVRLNPAFKKVHAALGQDEEARTYYYITVVLPQALNQSCSLEQFVTTPPISDITVGTRGWISHDQKWKSPYYDNACTAHNKDGLKIKDVLAVRDALIATQCKFKTTELHSMDIMVQAGFMVEDQNAKGDRLEDRLLQNRYFQGFLTEIPQCFCQTRHRLRKGEAEGSCPGLASLDGQFVGTGGVR